MSLYKPESPEDGVTFDVATIAREIRAEDGYAKNGHTARTLIRADDLRVVVIALEAGSRIAEHQARGTASVHLVSGKVSLRIADRPVEMSAGQLLVLDRGLRHDVEASEDSTLVLTFGWDSK